MPKEQKPDSVQFKPKVQKRVSDVIPPSPWGDRLAVPLGEILNTEVLIEGYEVRAGEFGDYVLVGFTTLDRGDKFVTTTGGVVVTRKLGELLEKHAFPVIGTFTKPAKYYDLV